VDPIPNVAPFDPDNGNDGLPNTGGNVMSWWVVAYGLLAAGATSLLVAWSRRPISLR
jgi:LPXTG-motif cell wall-anchored protein